MSNLSNTSPHNVMKDVPFLSACMFWLKLGFISFGGPAGQIALMHQELVERKHWISNHRFMHALNFCMLLPGPEAQQLATYIGWLLHKKIGGIVAGVLFILPSLLILILLSWLYVAFGEIRFVAGAFYGIKPAVLAIVVYSAYRIGRRVLFNDMMRALAAISFVSITVFQVSFPIIIACSGLVGLIGGRYWSAHLFKPKDGSKDQFPTEECILANDASSQPAHTRYSLRSFLTVVACGLALWILPMAVLLHVLGWQHILPQMALFFTEAALLTFGGAYAVLPYVFQRAVHDFGWLSTQQMIDGLALGETTPGPLIMIVAYVGFLAGYCKAAVGQDYKILGGIAAACVATWFTFLPSFIFILGGGPIVESTHNRPSFTAPLTCISAAIVGVILNLAVFFGIYVFTRSISPITLDWIAIVISLGAYIGLARYALNTVWVIGACALLGIFLHL